MKLRKYRDKIIVSITFSALLASCVYIYMTLLRPMEIQPRISVCVVLFFLVMGLMDVITRTLENLKAYEHIEKKENQINRLIRSERRKNK